jgi:hypothetical protein
VRRLSGPTYWSSRSYKYLPRLAREREKEKIGYMCVFYSLAYILIISEAFKDMLLVKCTEATLLYLKIGGGAFKVIYILGMATFFGVNAVCLCRLVIRFTDDDLRPSKALFLRFLLDNWGKCLLIAVSNCYLTVFPFLLILRGYCMLTAQDAQTIKLTSLSFIWADVFLLLTLPIVAMSLKYGKE